MTPAKRQTQQLAQSHRHRQGQIRIGLQRDCPETDTNADVDTDADTVADTEGYH